MTNKFRLGAVLLTAALADWLHAAPATRHPALLAALARHAAGDWGDLDPEDRAVNDDALAAGDRLLSAYTVDAARIWIITEADRRVTTLLFPEDY